VRRIASKSGCSNWRKRMSIGDMQAMLTPGRASLASSVSWRVAAFARSAGDARSKQGLRVED
jgi:hypothetical protein